MSTTTGRPLRVLALDGGGIRGVIPATLLAEIENRCDGKRIAEMFDLIAGTSTGGILTLGLTAPDPTNPHQPRYRAEELVALYEQKGQAIFSHPLWYRLVTVFGHDPEDVAVETICHRRDAWLPALASDGFDQRCAAATQSEPECYAGDAIDQPHSPHNQADAPARTRVRVSS